MSFCYRNPCYGHLGGCMTPHDCGKDSHQHPKWPQEAIDNLTNDQVQCDMDGVMVQVSRQALDEVLAYLALSPADRADPNIR